MTPHIKHKPAIDNNQQHTSPKHFQEGIHLLYMSVTQRLSGVILLLIALWSAIAWSLGVWA